MEQPTQPSAPGQPAPKSDKNTGMAVVAYILFFIPLLTEAKHDPFVKYHVKQGLLLFIAWIVVSILTPVLFMITWLFYIVLLVFTVLGIMNALNGKQEPLPLVGKYAEKFNF